MAEYLIQDTTLTGIADAIREKTGGTDPVAVSDMAAQIEGIQAGGGDIDALIDGSLAEISSNVKTVLGHKFRESKLKTANFPAATSIGTYAFADCSYLETVNFPVAKSVGASAFRESSRLETVNFPVATSVGANAFQICSRLKTANFPMATSIEGQTFRSCSNLETAEFSVATSIGTYAFSSCSKLVTVILRSETMAALSNANAFSATPIASGTGYIYVPSALIEQYKVATNWSTYATQFRALEDYTVDGTVTGELDPAKTGT